jgi:hypothetical protein
VKNKASSCLIPFAIWLMTSDYALAAEAIIMRTSVTPEEAWVGQKVLLHLDVLAKDGWAQLKKVSDAEVEGAHLLRLESQGTRLSETIDGDSYTGQRYEFMLFAQRAGKIIVPPLQVDVEVRTWGAGADSQIHRMTTRHIEFTTRTPPGAEGIRGLISTTGFTAKQEWEPKKNNNPQVGDAIKRTITLRAEDLSGMAFTPMLHGKIEHLGIYPGEPTVEDKFARGDLTGTRVETVTYVFERPGEFEIPGIVLPWWDVRNADLKRIELPALSLHVSGNHAAESMPVEPSAPRKNTRLLWSALLAVLIAAVVALRFGGRMAKYWAAWWRTRGETEATYFRRALRSVRSGDQKTALRDTMRWLDRINTNSRPARLDQFLRQYGDARVQEAAFDLVNTLTPDRHKPDVTALASGLTAARRRWRQAQRDRERVTGLLPGLNGGR